MVPRLLGGALVVITIVGLFMITMMSLYVDQVAEGPYRKRENCRCVCK